MTPQELKNSILQLAIQGKLVEQRSEEGTGEELYQQIQKEKAKLIKEGKIKKKKPLPDITEDEISFDIPESWKWVRLGSLLQVISGVSYKKGEVQKKGIRVLRGGNIQNMQVLLDEDDVFLPDKYGDEIKQVRHGDILIVASTGSKAVIGKAGFVDRNIPKTVIGAFLRICRPHFDFMAPFLKCIFESDFYRRHIRNLVQGTNINNVKEAYITEFIIPLPPLTEQKRIVAKIEELLPFIDRYEDAWSKLEEFNERFPMDMQKSLLQYAIQGKLVEQRSEEGTGEELYQQIQKEKAKLIKEGKIKKKKPLPDITEDEISFDIPESWKWVRLGSLLQVISGVSYKKGEVQKKGIRVLRGGNIQNMQVLLDEDDVFLPDKYGDEIKQVRHGDILIVASTGSKAVIGKAGFVDRNIPKTVIGAFLRICRPHFDFMAPFLKCIFESDFYRRHIRNLVQGTNINNVKEAYITEFIIPLPPLTEQKRIVAKLEELLPLCDKLK